jgi:dTMP kinase
VELMAGKLIVLEGTDGSGKSTQFARLCRRLEEEKRPFHRVIFPRYDKESSALVRMYLGGEFGQKPGDVNAYAASAFYAVDRYASYRQDWGQWYEEGGLVMADRYTTSNAVHQASKLPKGQRADFFHWLYDFEFDKLGLPRPDLVIYLDMPTRQALSLLRGREEATHTKGDIHEVDDGYLALCRETALEAAEVLGWQVMPCVRDGDIRPVEELHEAIWKLISEQI